MPYTYRGYTVEVDHDHPRGWWSYVHPQYDGPPDPRCGHAETLDEVRTQIDDLHDTHPRIHGPARRSAAAGG